MKCETLCMYMFFLTVNFAASVVTVSYLFRESSKDPSMSTQKVDDKDNRKLLIPNQSKSNFFI